MLTKGHGTAIVVLLALTVLILAQRSYLHRPPALRFEYRSTEMPAIDLGAVQRAGDEGWNCNPIMVPEGASHHFVMFCRREIH